MSWSAENGTLTQMNNAISGPPDGCTSSDAKDSNPDRIDPVPSSAYAAGEFRITVRNLFRRPSHIMVRPPVFCQHGDQHARWMRLVSARFRKTNTPRNCIPTVSTSSCSRRGFSCFWRSEPGRSGPPIFHRKLGIVAGPIAHEILIQRRRILQFHQRSVAALALDHFMLGVVVHAMPSTAILPLPAFCFEMRSRVHKY